MCIVFHLRKTNQMVMDSRCRGGIVNSRGGRSCALFVRPQSPKALWRFRVSTANSLLNKVFEYVKMTICSRQSGSILIPRRFDFFA